MQYTDGYGDTYELAFRSFWEKDNHGIEAVTVNCWCSEVYCCIAEYEPEYFNKNKHEHPSKNCLWASKSDLTEQLVMDGLLKCTGRTMAYLGTTLYEVMPNEDWWTRMATKGYQY